LLQNNKKSPLERGAALAAGCVIRENIFTFYSFNYFSVMFRQKHTRHYRATHLKRGFFVAIRQINPFRATPIYRNKYLLVIFFTIIFVNITPEMTGGFENFKFKDGYPVQSIDLLYFFIAVFGFAFLPKLFLSIFFIEY